MFWELSHHQTLVMLLTPLSEKQASKISVTFVGTMEALVSEHPREFARKKGVRNWSWPLTGNVKIHSVEALVSGPPREAQKGVRNWSWPLTGNVKIHTVDALVSGHPRDAKKVPVTGAGRLRE